MDYLIKAFAFLINVYGEQVQILSFGEPVKSEEYKDYFGRASDSEGQSRRGRQA